MEFVTRLAGQHTHYPLATHGTAEWQRTADGCWHTELTLPEVPEGHIIVPSFCALHDAPLAHQFSLHTHADTYRLNAVPSAAEDQISHPPPDHVSCHIDCWHTHSSLSDARIQLQLKAPVEPTQYLLTVSVRTLELPAEVEPLPPATAVNVAVPESLSQMSAADNIRGRICSPTALAMALSVVQSQVDWNAAIEACYDPLTKAYGAWPLAIRHAANCNIIAAVECFSRWSEAVQVLQAGSPLVCSIRFGKGQLQHAPLAQTGGHLVVLHGIDGDHVLVKDPAADQPSGVARRYLAEEFSHAWLQRRGAAYIFALS